MKMHRTLLVLLACALGGTAGAGFDGDFTGATLRVDYYHTGTADQEHFAVHRIRIEGPWPGSRTQLIDTSNLGKYLVEVVDLGTNRLLYSRGLRQHLRRVGDDGRGTRGNLARDRGGRAGPRAAAPVPAAHSQAAAPTRASREVWSLTIDPASRFVDRRRNVERRPTSGNTMENGDPAVEGRPRDSGRRLHGRQRLEKKNSRPTSTPARAPMRCSPSSPSPRASGDFNVWADQHADRAAGHLAGPAPGVFRDTPLGARYNSFDSERYILTPRGSRPGATRPRPPYDFVLILVNERKYGGGGIFNLYSTAAMGSAFAPSTSSCTSSATTLPAWATSTTPRPWPTRTPRGPRRALGAQHHGAGDPERLKWRDLVGDDTPLPTPWVQGRLTSTEVTREFAGPSARAALQGARRRSGSRSCSAKSSELFTKMLGRRSLTPARSAPSRERCTNPDGLLPPRPPTASCSPVMTSASAQSATAP